MMTQLYLSLVEQCALNKVEGFISGSVIILQNVFVISVSQCFIYHIHSTSFIALQIPEKMKRTEDM